MNRQGVFFHSLAGRCRTEMTAYQREHSGLVLPKRPPEKVKDLWPLEIAGNPTRRTVSGLLASIVDELNDRFSGESYEKQRAQKEVVYFAGKQLLGEDWECEELT